MSLIHATSAVDVLVGHAAISETATGFVETLHAKPRVWGQMATDAKVGTVVLSHLSSLASANEAGEVTGFDEKLADVRARYQEPLVIAEDLMGVPVGAT